MSLTIAIPTLGRPTLARTVFSFIEQLEPGDEVILVADPKGDRRYVQFMRETCSSKLGVDWKMTTCAGDGWGLPQRNRAYEMATPGNHVWCLADDDIATPGALNAIRTSSADDEKSWFVFRAGRGNAAPWVWQTAEVKVGNIDADCLVVPAGVESRWGLEYTGDLALAQSLVAELGQPWFAGDVIAVTKPNEEYLQQHYGLLAGHVATIPGTVEVERR